MKDIYIEPNLCRIRLIIEYQGAAPEVMPKKMSCLYRHFRF